ncbi:MAG: hypothetical protein RLZZ535_1316 [Cyanobacteriota bacterium]|jgi:hypothetical protein
MPNKSLVLRPKSAFTRLTASEAIAELQNQGFKSEQIPAPSTMAVILNRMGCGT